MNLLNRLGHELLFFDGAMGTTLQKHGLGPGELPEVWNITKKDIIKSIHKAYIESGADIIKSNTFGANSIKLSKTQHSVSELISAGLNNAKEAIRESGKEAYVALDIGPLGKLMAPFGDLEFEDAVAAFSEMVESGKDNADLILIETMTDVYEAKAAVIAAKEHSDLPIFITFAFEENGHLLTGADITTVLSIFEALGVSAIGFNCGLGPKQLKSLVPKMFELSEIPIIANPNAGLPITEDGKVTYKVSPEEFSDDITELIESGACIVGGCCGTTPEHIAKTFEKCQSIKPNEIKPNSTTTVSSYSKTLIIDKPYIVGERINPTGKPHLQEAITSGDYGDITDEAFAQIDNGASLLDVNVFVDGVDEEATMSDVISELQMSIKEPLIIDSLHLDRMEKAIRLYNGKPFINGCNGTKESLEKVLPLAKKYGCSLVALVMDENGIPKTMEDKIKIAERIISEADKLGIRRKDIFIDTLSLSLSTCDNDTNASLAALECLKKIYGVKTILGISNISYGLPNRKILNSTYLAAALEKGLDLAILNPNDKSVVDTYYAFLTISGKDDYCMGYIERFR